jgi:hypothetical protein
MKTQLSLEESMAWESIFGHYAEQGYSDEEADKRTWEDLKQHFPRLIPYNAIANEHPVPR